jgi:hypothetical protein
MDYRNRKGGNNPTFVTDSKPVRTKKARRMPVNGNDQGSRRARHKKGKAYTEYSTKV